MQPEPSIRELSSAQRQRLARFNAQECVDVHCHCLPGLDDGPATIDAAIDLCKALVDDGITVAIATPHQFGRYEGKNSAATVREAVAQLRIALAEKNIPLRIEPGGDVRIDHRLPGLLRTDEAMTLADTGLYILLELPHETFVELSGLIDMLSAQGVRSIISHPERHEVLKKKPDAMRPWIERGAVLQVTSASLTGGFGTDAMRAAWHMLDQGMVQLVSSDAHDCRRRPPSMTSAIEILSTRLSHITARRLCMENPLRVLKGENLPTLQLRPVAGGRR